MSERLLVPGVLEVVLIDDDGRALVETGPLADVPVADLTAWSARAWFAPRRGLPALDLASAPHVRARLERARWELVTAEEAQARRGEGPGVLRLEGRPHGGARITWERRDGSEVGVDASNRDLWVRVLGEPPDDDTAAWSARHAECVPVEERVVQAISDGAISLRDVDLALWAAGLVPDLLPFEEAVLAEVEVHAADQREVAESLASAVADATDDFEHAPVGRVRRVVAPAFDVPTSAGDVRIPEAVSWVVEGVVDWEPEASDARRQARFELWRGKVRDAKAKGRRRERRVWITIGVLLALGLAVGVLGFLAAG